MSNSPEFRAWAAMLTRCYNPNAKHYHRYGGRGIQVCPEWREDFEAFFAYLGPKPSKGHTVDRIKNDGNYEPGNVRWATPGTQSRNKATNRYLEFNGRRMVIKDWSALLSCSDSVIRSRLRRGWSVGKTLTAPIRRNSAGGKVERELRKRGAPV